MTLPIPESWAPFAKPAFNLVTDLRVQRAISRVKDAQFREDQAVSVTRRYGQNILAPLQSLAAVLKARTRRLDGTGWEGTGGVQTERGGGQDHPQPSPLLPPDPYDVLALNVLRYDLLAPECGCGLSGHMWSCPDNPFGDPDRRWKERA